MIDNKIKTEILHRLKQTEEQENVRILMAIESGSRAWGFASPNSDYDVRFIYARHKDWYVDVNLEAKRDVIEYPIVDEIDLNGWDVRKALKLFSKSNPAFVEWIKSPIVYINNGNFREESLNLLSSVYSVEKGIYHYKSMAKKNYRGYLREKNVPLKKYFYVLRPLLAIRWIEKYGESAPIEFDKVLNMLKSIDVLEAINDLLELKRSSKEMHLAPAIPVINQFIENELHRLDAIQLNKHYRNFNMQQLNDLFYMSLVES